MAAVTSVRGLRGQDGDLERRRRCGVALGISGESGVVVA